MTIEYPCVHFDKGKCKKFSDDKVTSWCVEGPCVEQMLSNADRIRAMNDEELAEFLGGWAKRHRAWMCDSQGECLAWLQESTKDGEGDDRQRKAD